MARKAPILPPSSSSSSDEEQQKQTSKIPVAANQSEPKSKKKDEDDEEEEEEEDGKQLKVATKSESEEEEEDNDSESDKQKIPQTLETDPPTQKKKKSPFQRLYSFEDDLRILEALRDDKAQNGPIKVLAITVSNIIHHASLEKNLSVNVSSRNLYDKVRKLKRNFEKRGWEVFHQS